jgi:hypothetical protein
MVAKYPPRVEDAMRYTFANLNERQRRLFAATEALKLGHGGIAYVASVLGCHRRTVERGLGELDGREPPPPPEQARKKGAGESDA